MKGFLSVNIAKVMVNYSLNVKNVSLLSDKGRKAVWLINAASGDFILKKIPMSEGRLKFMIHSISFLTSNGVMTPSVMRTTNGREFVAKNGEYYVLFEKVYGKKPKYNQKKELAKIMSGLGQFHKASTGIEIPKNTEPSFLLGTWKDEFQRRYKQLEIWRKERILASNKNKFDEQFLLHVDSFLSQCNEAISILDASCYEPWVGNTQRNKTLCHQDFAAGNLALDKKGKLHVFDMDSLTIDLPIRDIRKILNKVMKKQSWDLTLMIEMLSYYQKTNPFSKEQYFVLIADCLFPHLFYGQVKKYYGNTEREWTEKKHLQRLKGMIAIELSKEKVLQAFKGEIDKVLK